METRKEIKYFTIVEHEKEQEYLRNMHRSGWKLIKVTGLTVYHFEKCVPEDVIYQLDYNQEGIAHKEEYVQMFRDCGWEYIQDYVGYSYFCKPAAAGTGAEEIFCDDESRLQMADRVFKGRMLPLLAIFFAVLLPQFFRSLSSQRYLIAAFMGGILGLYVLVFAIFAISYWKYKKRVSK